MSEKDRSPEFPHLPAESWELFVIERLPEASRRRLEEHLDGCKGCTAVLEARDPSRVFRRLQALEVREDRWQGAWESLRAEIAALQPSRKDPSRTERKRQGQERLSHGLVHCPAVNVICGGDTNPQSEARPKTRFIRASSEVKASTTRARSSESVASIE